MRNLQYSMSYEFRVKIEKGLTIRLNAGGDIQFNLVMTFD